MNFGRSPNPLFRRLLGAILVVFACESAIALSPDDDLTKALVPIRFGTNIPAVEAESAKLLQQHTNSPEALGRIYLSLALNSEYVHINDFSNIIETSQSALQYPLDVMDACSAYHNLADGLRMKMMSSGHAFSPRLNEREQTEMRKQILDVHLNALKLVLGKATTLQKREVPGVPTFSVALAVIMTNATQTQEEREKYDALNRTNALWYQKALQENQAQWKAHDEIVAANDLVDQYNRFKRDVIDLYRGIPFVEEIAAEAEKVAPGDPKIKELAVELVEEVKKSNVPPPISEPKPVQ